MNEPALPMDEYVLQYQLTPKSASRCARPGALVLHPGPMIRGLEIDPAVADGPQSCVLEQVTNGVAVRMALLFLLIGVSGDTSRPENATPRASSNAKGTQRMLWIKNGRVIDPASGTDAALDVLIEGEHIAHGGSAE